MRTFLYCVSLFMFSVGCASKQSSVETLGALPQTGEVIAMVNGVPVTQESIDMLIAYFAQNEEDMEMVQQRIPELVEQMVLTELLYQNAISENIQQSPEHQFLIALAIRTTLSDIYIKEKMDEILSEEHLREVYTDRIDSYQRTQFEMSMIIVDNEVLAKVIVDEAKAGSDFEQLVLEHSLDEQSKAEGGRLPLMYLEELPPIFGTALSEATAGDVIGPISLGNSVGIFKVFSINPIVIPFEEMKDILKQELASNAEFTITEELKSEASIEYTKDN